MDPRLGSLVQSIFICICYTINLPLGIVVLLIPSIIHIWNASDPPTNKLQLIPFISLIPFALSFLFDSIFMILILPLVGILIHVSVSVMFNFLYRDPNCTPEFKKFSYYNMLSDFSLFIVLTCPIMKYYMVTWEFFLIPLVISILYALGMLYFMLTHIGDWEAPRWGGDLTDNEEQQQLFGINDDQI